MSAAPMVPPAPPLFSTSTGWPRFSLIFCPTRRATMSVVPPAGNGTTTLIGLDGKDWANAAPHARPRSRTKALMSLGLDPGLLDQHRVLLQLARDQVVELLDRHRQRIAAELADRRSDLGRLHQVRDIGVQLVDDRARRLRRHHRTDPEVVVGVGIA